MPTDKIPVSSAQFENYIRVLETGYHNVSLLPGKISQCDFTPHQRVALTEARRKRAKLIKASAKAKALLAVPTSDSKESSIVVLAPVKQEMNATVCDEIGNAQANRLPGTTTTKTISKLQRILFLQSNLCFYCQQPLSLEHANIEHVVAKSLGGKSEDDNEVACHRSVNSVFSNLSAKRKLEVIIRSKGTFKCP